MASASTLQTRIAAGIFLGIAILNIICEARGFQPGILVTKPLLMISLALTFSLGLPSSKRRGWVRWFFASAFFSWGGDVLLLFTANPGFPFFIAGLSSFLLAHLCYLLGFRQILHQSDQRSYLRGRWWLVLPFAGYLLLFHGILWEGLGSMRIPVIVYSLVIVAMALGALQLRTAMKASLFRLLFGGILLFVLSDSLIAVNMFAQPVPGARWLIMLTYITAQTAIFTAIWRYRLNSPPVAE